MALPPDPPDITAQLIPLSTGFTYTPRSELENFELPPDVAADLANRLAAIDEYHQRSAAEVAASDIVLR